MKYKDFEIRWQFFAAIGFLIVLILAGTQVNDLIKLVSDCNDFP